MKRYYVFYLKDGTTLVKRTSATYDKREDTAVNTWTIEAKDAKQALDKVFANLYNAVQRQTYQLHNSYTGK